MTAVPNTTPTRFKSGYTPEQAFQAWADCGAGDPFFYHMDWDDFDESLAVTGMYTTTLDGGTAALTAGDGGLGLLTTAAANNDFVTIQRPIAAWTIPQGALAGKKAFWAARLQLGDVTNSALIAGLCDTTATLFTTITDGIWFSKASGGTQLVLNIAQGGTKYSFNVATNTYALANATPFDLAWYVDKYGNVQYSVGAQLFGYVPQSGIGTGTGAPQYYPANPVLCPTGKLYSGNQPYTVASGYVLPTANLALTLGVQAGAAAAKTLIVDFHGAAKER
jgi:hypothetical protein